VMRQSKVNSENIGYTEMTRFLPKQSYTRHSIGGRLMLQSLSK
jgi:hypothetical protein